jgi:hypothetical protein
MFNVSVSAIFIGSRKIVSHRIRGVVAAVVAAFKADLAPDDERFIAHCKWLLSQNCGQLPIRWKLDLLLDVVHHGHGGDQDDGCNYLV